MRAYEAIAETLMASGIDSMFGLMGEGNLELIAHLTDRWGVRFYGARHEAGAIAMADGYSRVTQKVGVCTVTQGPGFTNALTPMTAAARNGSRLLLIAADTPLSGGEHPQAIDQAALCATIGVESRVLTRPGSVGHDTAAALGDAYRRRHPIVLHAPADVQKGQAKGGRAGRFVDDPVSVPNAAEIRVAADVISMAQRPVIIAGRGATMPSAREALERIGDMTGALMATSLLAKGFFTGSPFHIGIVGGYSSPLAVSLIAEADCLIVFGASLNNWQTRSGALVEGKKIIRCDVAPGAATGPRSAVTLTGDAAATAGALADELAQRGHSLPGLRSSSVAEAIAQGGWAGVEWPPALGRLHPEHLTLKIEHALPVQRTLVVDGGHFTGYPSMHMSTPDPSGFIYAIDFGATGLGFGSAIGAAVGRPDRTATLIIGDGGFLMTVAELDTAVRYRLPMLVFVMNDGAYGSEVHHLRIRGLPDRQAIFETPRLDKVAESFGADGMRFESLDQLPDLSRRASRLNRPLVVDALIDGDVMADWFRDFATRAAASGQWT